MDRYTTQLLHKFNPYFMLLLYNFYFTTMLLLHNLYFTAIPLLYHFYFIASPTVSSTSAMDTLQGDFDVTSCKKITSSMVTPST